MNEALIFPFAFARPGCSYCVFLLIPPNFFQVDRRP